MAVCRWTLPTPLSTPTKTVPTATSAPVCSLDVAFADLRAEAPQGARFDAFRDDFNTERHEALAMNRPAEIYSASSRPYASLQQIVLGTVCHPCPRPDSKQTGGGSGIRTHDTYW